MVLIIEHYSKKKHTKKCVINSKLKNRKNKRSLPSIVKNATASNKIKLKRENTPYKICLFLKIILKRSLKIKPVTDHLPNLISKKLAKTIIQL